MAVATIAADAHRPAYALVIARTGPRVLQPSTASPIATAPAMTSGNPCAKRDHDEARGHDDEARCGDRCRHQARAHATERDARHTGLERFESEPGGWPVGIPSNLATLGDVNGDGVEDLFMSCYGYARQDSLQVVLFGNVATGAKIDVSKVNGWRTWTM